MQISKHYNSPNQRYSESANLFLPVMCLRRKIIIVAALNTSWPFYHKNWL